MNTQDSFINSLKVCQTFLALIKFTQKLHHFTKPLHCGCTSDASMSDKQKNTKKALLILWNW